MRKDFIISIIAMSVLFGFMSFAKDYKDAEPVILEMVVSFEKFIGGLEKANTAPEVASVINEYSSAISVYAPKFKKILKKYPELEDEKTHPESLKPHIKKMEDMTKKLMKLYGKITKFMNDPEVKKAFENMTKISAQMDPDEDKEGEEN